MTDVKSDRRKSAFVLAFTLLLSFIFITICSKASFLYPMQDWVDVNCFFTVGRSMLEGKVVYRDIFEQKGPLLYFIYALIALFWKSSFFGVYLLEVVSLWAFLYTSYKCLKLYTKGLLPVLIGFPLIAYFVTMSEAFCHGGSVEELCLFCFSYSLYVFLRVAKTGVISKRSFFIMGLLVAFVFWIKYIMLGFYIGAFVAMGAYTLYKKRFSEYFKACLIALLAFLIASVPILFYFVINGALYDLFYTYFYCNMFLYSTLGSVGEKLGSMVSSIFLTASRNISFFGLSLIGIVISCFKKNGETLLVLSSFASLLVFTYIGGVYHPYYSMSVASFSVFGLCMLSESVPKILTIDMSKKICALFSSALILILSFGAYHGSRNAYLMHVERENMPQYRFARQINEVENATMLNYGWLDMGMYYASGTIPSEKYFCTLNAPIEKMYSEMRECVIEGRVDFIVSSYPIEDEFGEDFNYTRIDDCSFYFECATYYYYLYKNNSLMG